MQLAGFRRHLLRTPATHFQPHLMAPCCSRHTISRAPDQELNSPCVTLMPPAPTWRKGLSIGRLALSSTVPHTKSLEVTICAVVHRRSTTRCTLTFLTHCVALLALAMRARSTSQTSINSSELFMLAAPMHIQSKQCAAISDHLQFTSPSKR